MKLIHILTVAAVAAATPVLAQNAAPEIPKRATIYSADGTKIGRVERIVENSDGSPSAVKVIYRGKFLTIPAGTLTAADKGLTTSLTNSDIKKM